MPITVFPLLILKAFLLNFQNNLPGGRVALHAAAPTRTVVFVMRTLSYWLLNCGLFCGYLCLLALWELRMRLLNKGSDLCSDNIWFTVWCILYSVCFEPFFFWEGVLFLPWTLTEVDTLFHLSLMHCALGFFVFLCRNSPGWLPSHVHSLHDNRWLVPGTSEAISFY